MMDCCKKLSPEEEEDRQIHRLIQKQLKKDKKKISKDVRLLLLGTGESGKTTFVKQMRIIHQKGFSPKEKKAFTKVVYENMFTAMQSMIKAMDLLKINYNFPEIMESVQLISRINANEGTFDKLNVYALKKLWAFDGIKESYSRRRQYQLNDSTEYFFENIDRVAAPDYIPTEDDILRVRVETKGVQEHEFNSKEYNIRITDIAGQRSKRSKWFDLFEICHSMIFLSAISEYDQVLIEDNKVNRLVESIELFGKVIENRLFTNKANVLFLNKTDILEKKIMDSNLVDYFPQYEGQPGEVIAARKFIQKMFVDNKTDKNGALYVFFTCATDTKNIQKVFDSVRTSIIDDNLGKSPLL